ncbi:MAG: phosphopantetheine-binding protein [Clostridia bacterium]|nr:phosphopantetheine-binding protein [Clostridia bacterium]
MDVIEELKKIISDSIDGIDTENVTAETSIKNDLCLSSLEMMMLSIIIEDRFGFEFKDSADFDTVGDLCYYIEKESNLSEGGK